MKCLESLKIALLIVILAEEIKRARKNELYSLSLQESKDAQGYGYGNLNKDELIQKLIETNSFNGIKTIHENHHS